VRTDNGVACATLGELGEDNHDSWLCLKASSDATSNVDFQFLLNRNDKRLWDLMDLATFQTIEALALDSQNIEYWSEHGQGWIKRRPSKTERRSPMLVHEAGLTSVGDAQHPRTLDEHFKVRGCDNVVSPVLSYTQKHAEFLPQFVTGGGILPTAGSWNPTLAICGFAQEVARDLAKDKLERS
jgi:hypothetical protein